MLFATASATGKDKDGNHVPAATRLYDWPDNSLPPRLLFEAEDAPSPSFLAFHKNSNTLFVTSEMDGEGSVSAFAVDGHTLVFKGSRTTNGNAAVHMALDQSGRWAAVANYRAEKAGDDMAFAIFPVGADGALGALAASLPQDGSGPDPSRQEGPHTHCVMFSPDNRMLAAVDLGTDGLWLYHFDQMTGTTRLAREVKLPAGSGPRHCVFHPSRPFLYVCGELDSTLMTLRYDPAAGTAELLDSTAATPPPLAGRNYPSGLAISLDGHYLMLANRGPDTIANFWIDPETGLAHLREAVFCDGRFPRAIRLDGAGQLLAVANQKSGSVTFLQRDFASGSMFGPSLAIDLPSAMDVIFLDQ